jgi:phosphoglycolate phosphatase-like HAD superfamily hydrolase
VRELGFEDGVDTLGRWMAHHLAELIAKAENSATAAERSRARKNTMETILKIWEHRATLPRKAYPLAPYKEVLKVLDRLRPDDNPFRYFGHHAETKREQLAADLFDSLSRLIIALLLMKLPPGEESTQVDAAIEALSETERHVLTALQQWSELFVSTPKSSGRTRKSKQSGATVNLNKAAVSLIDGITATLAELRSDLQQAGRPAWEPLTSWRRSTKKGITSVSH